MGVGGSVRRRFATSMVLVTAVLELRKGSSQLREIYAMRFSEKICVCAISMYVIMDWKEMVGLWILSESPSMNSFGGAFFPYGP